MADSQDELQALRAQISALTARVYRLELEAGLEKAPPQRPAAAAPPPPPTAAGVRAPAVPLPPASFRQTTAPPAGDSGGLEGKIGKVWLNRIGIIAILAGVSYFIKYAFDSGWIGPAGRVAIGLIAGIAVTVWSESFRKKNYVAFSYSLKAIGIGTLYLSLWGAFQVYHLIPSSAAFLAMIVVTGSTIVLALTQDAEILAAFALIGGFSTPVLLSTHQNHEIVLFSYVALLNVAMLVISAFKPWRRLMWGSFLGTAILYSGWWDEYYRLSERTLTVGFAALFAAIFAAIPLVTPLDKSRWRNSPSVTLMLLPLINAAAFFLALFAMYQKEKVTLTWYALGLAAVYLVLSNLFHRRSDADPETLKVVNLIHVAIAVGFITIAIPLKLDAQWITIGWLIESGVLLLFSERTGTNFLRYFAGATLALGVIRLLFIDSEKLQTALVFNARFATYLVAIAILGGIVAAGERVASSREMPWVKLAGVALNLLALIALTLEAHDYFTRQIAGVAMGRIYAESRDQLQLAWDFSYSAIWLIYGAGMMVFGFWKRDAFVRWQALVLIAFTIGKVFVYDTWTLEKIYRILSFIGLGVVLMAISYVYHRDWLKLSPKPAVKGASQ